MLCGHLEPLNCRDQFNPPTRPNSPGGRRKSIPAAALLWCLAVAVPLMAQSRPPLDFNERAIDISKNALDKEGIWVLDFHFQDPRVIVVDDPVRGRRLVWYLWYQVANTINGNPGRKDQTFVPKFVWVCHDNDSSHSDQILIKAQQEIARLEDRQNILGIKNSVTISKDPIPFSEEFDEKGERKAWPRMVTGVAMWTLATPDEVKHGKARPEDINPRFTNFSIYVYGLSDGWTAVDGPDGKPIIRRKTLQLKFKRLGDEFNQNAGQVRYLGHEWIYATIDPVVEEKPKPADKP
jgi:hypothetical protein